MGEALSGRGERQRVEGVRGRLDFIVELLGHEKIASEKARDLNPGEIG